MTEQVVEIYTDRIIEPRDPLRLEIDRDSLFDLANNIKQNGLINPITVRPVGDMYEVVAGHRRLMACRIAGLVKVPCVVRELDDHRAFCVKFSENLRREDINPVEAALAIKRYMEESGRSISEVAKELGYSTQWVATRLLINEMPDYLQEYLRRGDIKLGAAVKFMEITDEATRRAWVDIAVRDGASVAQVDYWVHGWKMGQLPGGVPLSQPPEGYEGNTAGPVMFRCALDGQEYDARLFKTVMIYEGNMPVFEEFVKEYRRVADSGDFKSAEPSAGQNS